MAYKLCLIFLILGMGIVAESFSPYDVSSWRRQGYLGPTQFEELETEMLLNNELGIGNGLEFDRRILAQTNARYISYDALKADSVPCNQRGQSYYNCNQRERANPYRRGCTVITHCYRYTH